MNEVYHKAVNRTQPFSTVLSTIYEFSTFILRFQAKLLLNLKIYKDEDEASSIKSLAF